MRFKAWQTERVYADTIPNIEAKSKVAAMQLAQADLLMMGPDEQISVRNLVTEAYDRCTV